MVKFKFLKCALILCAFLLLNADGVFGQQSIHTVKYKVTYDSITQLYTTWVVPDYITPNIYNVDNDERGGTAQFTLVVPKDFVISNITDVNGIWIKETDPSFIKLGPGQIGQSWPTLDTTLNYYVIGKSALEASYGNFAIGVAVPLFTFTGNGCYGPVRALSPNDPFINAADSLYSLNTANSFYSRSGQPAGGNQVPLEQFINIIDSMANCARPPIAKPDSTTTQVGVPKNIVVLTNDEAADGSMATLVNVLPPSVTTPPTNGSVVVKPDGSIDYTPNPNFSGVDTFTYTICDSLLPTFCSTTTVTIIVTCPSPPCLPVTVSRQ